MYSNTILSCTAQYHLALKESHEIIQDTSWPDCMLYLSKKFSTVTSHKLPTFFLLRNKNPHEPIHNPEVEPLLKDISKWEGYHIKNSNMLNTGSHSGFPQRNWVAAWCLHYPCNKHACRHLHATCVAMWLHGFQTSLGLVFLKWRYMWLSNKPYRNTAVV